MQTASSTRLLPLHSQRVRQSRVLAKPYALKGDAEVPTDKELVRLELKARRKFHADRERLQPLHNQLVAEMREQLEREQLLPGSIGPSNAGVLSASGTSEQEVLSQAALLDVSLYDAAAVIELGPIWCPQFWYWPMDPFADAATFVDTHPHPLLLLQPPNQVVDYTNHELSSFNRSGVIRAVGVTQPSEAVSISNFEELFDAFPLASFH
ncbi:hypothetical protein HDU80_000666 [Chytriomyces hyalinus]|nr:hypothetical protein HDU80_000666 [Chytriomyces hyalinus]